MVILTKIQLLIFCNLCKRNQRQVTGFHLDIRYLVLIINPKNHTTMNNSRTLLTAVFILALMWGCADEISNDPIYDVTEEIPVELNEIEAIIATAAELDGGMSHLRRGRSFIILPDGSVDALENAIVSAGKGGVVVVKSGMHTESATVTVPFGIRIVGEPGAVLEVDTDPSNVVPEVVEPALHILNADRTLIWGLHIRPPSGNTGSTGILVENSERVVIAKNTIENHQFSILVEQGDHGRIWKNEIIATLDGLTGIRSNVHGIVVVNGDRVHIVDNMVTNANLGVWACDGHGKYMHNTTQGNFIGLILCKVPANFYQLPGGNLAGAEYSGNNWFVANNQSMNNFNVGYIVIDGSNNNLLVNNDASSNGTYDIELAGESHRFGFLTPTSFDNKVVAGKFKSISIKDCGIDNKVIGGQQVDIVADPCY